MRMSAPLKSGIGMGFDRGSSSLNRLLDGAGRHRRIAAASLLVAIDLGFMGLVLLVSDGWTIFALCHFIVSASLLWLARDLIQRASLVDAHGLPLASNVALVAAVVFLRLAVPGFYAAEFGSVPALAPSLIGLVIAAVLLVAAELLSSPPVAFGGRVILLGAGLAYGVTQVTRMVHGFDTYPIYSLGLGILGALILATVIFEARVLRLAIHWLFVGSGDGR